MGSYTSDYPDLAFSAEYMRFFQDFYRISDTPDAHDQYAQSFTKDATLVMASKRATGFSEILALRKGMWEKVQQRTHTPVKVFPFGSNSNEVMLYGTVDYVLKTGATASVDWSARATLTKEEGPVKMDYYQVYLDTAAQNPGK